MSEPHLIPVPRGMSPGFYAFMGAGCPRREDGTIMMLNPRRDDMTHNVDLFRKYMCGNPECGVMFVPPPDGEFHTLCVNCEAMLKWTKDYTPECVAACIKAVEEPNITTLDHAISLLPKGTT